MRLNICIIILSLLFTQTIFAKNDQLKEKNTFKNTRGSILELHVDANNLVIGTFTTAVASKECQQTIGIKRPITGYVAGSAITISVSYPSCSSVLTFIGNIDEDKGTIDATSIIARQSPQVFAHGSSTQFITHDTFGRVS